MAQLTHTAHIEYVISMDWTVLLIQFFAIFRLFTLYSQIGYLDVVIPPDFIAEDTSSDVIVPEGAAVKLTCRFVAFSLISFYCFHHKTFTTSKTHLTQQAHHTPTRCFLIWTFTTITILFILALLFGAIAPVVDLVTYSASILLYLHRCFLICDSSIFTELWKRPFYFYNLT